MTTQNLQDAAKAVLRGTFIAIQSYTKKQEKHHIAAKRTTTKKNLSGKKEIIKIRAEINEKEMKEIIAKINKAKSWFFEKINKTEKPLARLIKKKKGEKSDQQYQK